MQQVSAKWIYCQQQRCTCRKLYFPQNVEIFSKIYKILCVCCDVFATMQNINICQRFPNMYFFCQISILVKRFTKYFVGALSKVVLLPWCVFFLKRLRQRARPSRGSDRRGFEFRSLPLRGLTLLCGIYKKRKYHMCNRYIRISHLKM